MRTWDNWNRYFDNNNKPLHGCIQFMVKDGNTVAPIYDVDGTALDNPIITDIYGRTLHQVCIDEDVVAYFYKYVGNGIWSSELDIDTSDTSKWALQYTSESDLYVDINNEGRSSFAVMNIEELRDLNANDVMSIDGVKIVTLMGYNEAGDKEPINYIWNADSTEPDDGGAVIATDLIKGRWIMVCPTEHLDVRHYGVFPSDSQNMLDQTLAIQYALVYANNHGLRLFFDTLMNVQYYHYYKITNITLNPVNQIDVAKGVYFIDNDVTIHSQQTNAFRNDPYFLNGDTTLYSNYAKASWNIKAINKAKTNEPATYIIDSNSSSASVKSFQGWNIVVNQNISGYTFVQCNISGDSMISSSTLTSCTLDVIGCLSTDNTLQNLTLTEKMFNGSPMPQTAVNGCIADIDDFGSKVNLWKYLHWLMADFKDIDFKYVTIPADFYIDNQELGDRSYANFIGTGASHTFGESVVAHVYRFTNVRGNIHIPGNAVNQYVFDNCEINLTVGDRFKAYIITVKDSNIIFNDDLPNSTIYANSSNITLKSNYATVSIKDTTLEPLTSSTRLNTANFSSYSSIVNQEVSSANLLYKDSQINKDIYSVNNGTSIITYIDNCIWNNIQQHIASDTANTIISGAWTNNNATKANPIVIDLTNIANADAAHNYSYDGNTGTFLPKDVHLTWKESGCYSINEVTWYYYHQARPELFLKPVVVRQNARKSAGAGDTGWCYYCYGVWVPDNWNWGNKDMSFFSIGLKSKTFKMKVMVPFNGYEEASVSLSMISYFTFEYEIVTMFDGMNMSYPTIQTVFLHGPNYIPYSYVSPKDVPEASTPVIPPTGADDWYFNINVDIV